MKIIVTGASGAIGKELVKALEAKDHEVIQASRKNSLYKLDIVDPASIEAFFEKVGPFDALASVAGSAYWGPFEQFTDEQLYAGIHNKLVGQINLVRKGLKYIRDGGSFTLVSGVLADEPVPGSVDYAIANAGLHGFVLAAALELPRRLRINVVSPGLTDNTVDVNGPNMPGHTPVSIHRVINAYIKSIAGGVHGQIIRVY